MGDALTITDARLAGETVGLRCEDGLITDLGPGVTPAPDDEVVDAAGMHLVPPFVNVHTHAAMTLFRSYGDDPSRSWSGSRR
ncbi:MAG: hypothetical protein U5R31_03345 [Acidimicrobiia bacterium]|nr:hypothetical protein [Acidimicrobiia bacterium]